MHAVKGITVYSLFIVSPHQTVNENVLDTIDTDSGAWLSTLSVTFHQHILYQSLNLIKNSTKQFFVSICVQYCVLKQIDSICQ